MNDFRQYQVVRVCSLNKNVIEYDGWKSNLRPPAVGDIGTLVEILKADDLLDRYVVESTDGNGTTLWLSDFEYSEIEFLDDRVDVHLIFLRSERIILLKRPDLDWRQLQNKYDDYMTSLGPWSQSQIADYFAEDYTSDDERWPISKKELEEFFFFFLLELCVEKPDNNAMHAKPDLRA